MARSAMSDRRDDLIEVADLDLDLGNTFVIVGLRMRQYDRVQEDSWTYDNDTGPAVVISRDADAYRIMVSFGAIRRLHMLSSELVIPVQVSCNVW